MSKSWVDVVHMLIIVLVLKATIRGIVARCSVHLDNITTLVCNFIQRWP